MDEAPTDESWKSEITSLVGEASMCWEPSPTGVFDSEEAITIAFKICKVVTNLLKKTIEENDVYWKDAQKVILEKGKETGKSEAFSLVKKLIIEEMAICREENTPTSRLTSLFNKVSTLEGK